MSIRCQSRAHTSPAPGGLRVANVASDAPADAQRPIIARGDGVSRQTGPRAFGRPKHFHPENGTVPMRMRFPKNSRRRRATQGSCTRPGQPRIARPGWRPVYCRDRPTPRATHAGQVPHDASPGASDEPRLSDASYERGKKPIFETPKTAADQTDHPFPLDKTRHPRVAPRQPEPSRVTAPALVFGRQPRRNVRLVVPFCQDRTRDRNNPIPKAQPPRRAPRRALPPPKRERFERPFAVARVRGGYVRRRRVRA